MESPSNNGAYSPRIREIPASERPRERLRDLGPDALSSAELLAIVLRTGTAEQSALTLAGALLAKHGGLAGLAKLSYTDLMQEKGVGAAKASEIRAVIQLALRIRELGSTERLYMKEPAHVFAFLGPEMGLLDQEHLRVLLLNTRNQLLGSHNVYVGSVSTAQVRVSEVLREAIRSNAPCLIMVHNHPSGDPSPSPDDIALTKQAIEAGRLLNIEVLDHVIIGDRRYTSLQALGYI
jgi:DNA repair protein RadC